MPLVLIVDANGAPQTVSWPGQDAITDVSGALASGQAAQQIAAASAIRAGFLFQNTSPNAMLLVDVAAGAAWRVGPGQMFPPPGSGYPIPTGILTVAGGDANSAIGDTYTARVW